MDGEALAAAGVESPWCPSRRTIAPVRRTRRPRAISGIGLQLGTSTVRPHTSTRARSPSVGRLGRPLRGPTKSEYPPAGVGAIVGAASRARREQLRGSIPLPVHLKPDSGRPRRPGPAPIRASEGLRAPVAMVVSPRPERAGQADQDGRPSGAALPAIDLSVVRGVGSSMVVPGSVGSYRPVIAGAKLREGTTTILPRERALQGVGLSSMRFHPIGGGPKTTKMDKKHGPRQESHPLSDRPEFEWPCRT